MTKPGFKQLTIDNWLQPDKVSSLFASVSPIDGKAYPITGNEMLRSILRPNLIETVPTDVRALFEIARGALAYGYFFYPLYSLASEQLFRVLEAAIIVKCKEMGSQNSRLTFVKGIEYLTRLGVITEQERYVWDAIRQLRNSASHPNSQTILSPGMVIDILERTADKINSLFTERASTLGSNRNGNETSGHKPPSGTGATGDF